MQSVSPNEPERKQVAFSQHDRFANVPEPESEQTSIESRTVTGRRTGKPEETVRTTGQEDFLGGEPSQLQSKQGSKVASSL